MRDGVILRADIYHPKAEGRFPVLLQRTPYNKAAADIGVRGAARGYVVVVQDVRGRYTSEGDWYPFLHESNDGYETVEWAAALPYSNGKVGMFGGSYVGATQMLAAIAHPPHLAGICPYVTASNYYDEYWKRWSIEEHFADINVPVLHVAAWYDIFLGGSLRNYIGIKAHGANDAARRGQHLLVVIGGHAGSGHKIGEVDFGPAANL